MFNLERQQQILDVLQQTPSIRVSELAARLYTSQPTVRRDLAALEAQGKVQRTHGGVILRKATDAEIPLLYREDQQSASKRAIAKKAVSLVRDGDVIFMDASSTVSYVIPLLEPFRDLIVVTNSPKTSMKLGERGIKNYCSGGLLLRHSIAYVGSEAERFFTRFNADILFFSSRGYTENGFITDSSEPEASIRRVMIEHAAKRVYLCDSSKKGHTYAYNICKTTDADTVIDERG